MICKLWPCAARLPAGRQRGAGAFFVSSGGQPGKEYRATDLYGRLLANGISIHSAEAFGMLADHLRARESFLRVSSVLYALFYDQ